MTTIETSNNLPEMDIPVETDLSTAVEAVKQQKVIDQKKVASRGEKLDKKLGDLKGRIRRTAENIDRNGKRGNIEFDWETDTITSWEGHKVKVESIMGDNIKLEGLDLVLPLEQGVWLANFKNWLKFTYGTQKVKYTRGIKSRLRTFFVEKTKILHRYALERFCPICEDFEAGKKVEEWLNK